MVIGNGLMANSFRHYSDDNSIIVFASGVSNSQNDDESNFKREKDLLYHIKTKYKKDQYLIYFSTCSIYDPSVNKSAYVNHKLETEKFIILNFENYIIFRISNPVSASKNPYTVLNYLFLKIFNNESFDAWKNSERNILDIIDISAVCSYIIKHKVKYKNEIINIANITNYRTVDIIKHFSKITNKSPKCNYINRGSKFNIDTKIVSKIFKILKINIDSNYLHNVLIKYYTSDTPIENKK